MNWEQLKAILWLRWRLTRNQIRRSAGLGAVIAALLSVALAGLALVVCVGASIGGYFLMRAKPGVVMFVWDGVVLGVLLLSLISIVTELQRSESIDLTRLLHLPVSLRQVFVLNYLVSLVSPGTVLAVALMGGLSLGSVIGGGPRFALLLPLVAGFVFLYTAWFYCLRGWLLSLMINPRRRRSIIMWLTLGIILISQSPQLINITMQRSARRAREARRAAAVQATNTAPAASVAAEVATHATLTSASLTNTPMMGLDATNRSALREERLRYAVALANRINTGVPPLWLAAGAHTLAAGRSLPALWCAAGLFALGWLGLHRAYRSTLKFYRAEETASPVAAQPKARPGKPEKPARNWVAASLPWLAGDTAAMVLAQARSMTRAAEVRMMLALGLFFSIFLPAMILWRGGRGLKISEAAMPFVGLGVVVMVLFTLLQLVSNQFGCDREGFRGLVLLPTPRDRILLGKNLALLPLAALLALIPFVIAIAWAGLSLLAALSTVLEFAAGFLVFCVIGNLASILAPFRVAVGSLKPTKQTWQIALVSMGTHMLFPVFIAPVFVPPLLGLVVGRLGWMPGGLTQLIAAAGVLAAMFFLYKTLLPPMGRMLQRHETRILRAVTEAVE